MNQKEAMQRYSRAAHAVQTGVALEKERGSKDTEPKHLRVGINLTKTDHAALVRLLIAKGILTEEEYYEAICESVEAEQHAYEERLGVKLG